MADEIAYAYVPFSGKGDDSQRIVEGYVSSAGVDCDQQIVDQDWLKSELPTWLSQWGNIREQHNPAKAVGKAQAVDLTTLPGPYLAAKIVDDDAWAKVKAGVYNGFSVGIKGPKIVYDGTAKNGRIAGGTLIEISVVDRPANDAAKFVVLKRAGANEWKDMQSGAVVEDTSKAATPDLAKCDCGCDCGPDGADPDCDCPCAVCSAARAADDDDGDKAAKPDASKRKFDAAERRDAADSGAALPDGSFPIKNTSDLHNALRAIGRAKDPAKAKAHIKARARALGAESELPDDWKGADVDATKETDPEQQPATPDAEKARQPKSEPGHAHPFKGAHNHAHDDGRGGVHTHAHQHNDDDMHDHPHLMGTDARLLSPEDRAQAQALYRAADADLAKAAGEQPAPDPVDKAAADFSANERGGSLSRPAAIGEVSAILKDALQRITALEGQTDQDKDGDVDTEANMSGAMDKRENQEFQGAQRADGLAPGTLDLTFTTEADLKKYIDTTVADLTKAATADTTTATTELVKLAGGLAKGFEVVTSRLEASAKEAETTKAALADVQAELAKVKDLAQPVKGAVFAVDKGLGLEPDRVYRDGVTPEPIAAKQAAARLVAGMGEQERRDFHAELLKQMYTGGQ